MTAFVESPPLVSVVIPMLNEVGAIEDCLEGFDAQSYPADRLDVVVVDGGSTDGSREIVEKLARSRPWIRCVDNPMQKASAAFNRGIDEARGEVLCLFSAHGVPDPTYVERSVTVLEEAAADGVGGQYLHVGLDAASQAIGLAMVSPFGMASPHRFATSRREVDTISHPAYRLSSLRAVGRFDEHLERNSDYELNYRMRAAGMRLVFDPTVVSIYRPRRSLSALGRQFWWYGRWKFRVVERHPGSLRPRHLVAPAMVVASALLPLAATTRAGRIVALGVTTSYGALVAGAVATARPWDRAASTRVLAAAFPVMHYCWGAGFLTTLLQDRVLTWSKSSSRYASR